MSKYFYILSAGRPYKGKKPSILHNINNKKLIDFFVETGKSIKLQTIFISGFRNTYLKKKYPNVNFLNNEIWEKTGSGFSFLSNIKNYNNECLISYSDIIFDSNIIKTIYLDNSDVLITLDTKWKYRYSKRPSIDIKNAEKVSLIQNNILKISKDELKNCVGEFVGLVKLSKNSMQILKKINDQNTKKFLHTLSFSDIINMLLNEGLSINYLDLKGNWAELNYSNDLSKFILTTKAKTLLRLKSLVTKSKILDQFSFSYGNWQINEEKCISDIIDQYHPNQVIVRSSSINEDNFSESNAGLFLTELNINTTKKNELRNSIRRVFASYKNNNVNENILIQPMLTAISASGVIMTRLKDSGSPYYEVNIDKKSGKTDTITSGKSSDISTYFILRNADDKILRKDKYIQKLICATQEIEKILKYDSLDIEFAFTKNFDLYILQVRPLLIKSTKWGTLDKRVYSKVYKSKKLFCKYSRENNKVVGEKNILGIMPDWNPAEIIGVKPNKLSISLYEYLILNGNWSKQRSQYGYKNLGLYKLLKNISGHPYIDVRASLNSFLPNELNKKTSEKIVNFSLNYLEKNPFLHDKIEFEILPNFFHFNMNKWEKRFVKSKVLNKNEFKKWKLLLKNITVKGIKRTKNDYEKIFYYTQNSSTLISSIEEPLKKAFLLLEIAKKESIINFAHLARSAFISIGILKSLEETKVINQQEMDDFLNTIETISGEFLSDAYNCSIDKFTREDFIDKYGHLRPETYNICAKSYKSEPNLYIDTVIESVSEEKINKKQSHNGKIWAKAKYRVEAAFRANDFNLNISQIEEFFSLSIKGRELAKFYFTRNISHALECIKEWGLSKNINSKELSNLQLNEIRKYKNFKLEDKDIKESVVLKNKFSTQDKEIIDLLNFPPLICNANNFSFFEYPTTFPNYIGKKIIVGKTYQLNISSNKLSLEGKIVFIPNADPGYDWIFSQNILGFITMYGGTNSHMSIRASEFRMTAIIGTGKILFDNLKAASLLKIDPLNRNVKVLH